MWITWCVGLDAVDMDFPTGFSSFNGDFYCVHDAWWHGKWTDV